MANEKVEFYKPTFHDNFSGLKGVRRLGANYIWLLYSIFFFIDPLLRKSWWYWGECLGVYAVFLALYVGYVETKRPEWRLPLVIAIFAIGVVTIQWNSGASFFFIFGAALVPFAVKTLREALLWIGGAVVVVAGEWLCYRDHAINYGSAVGFILIVGLANLFVAEQQRSQCRLRKAQEENAALAQVAERERIARDLHDVLGHTLSVIVLKAELAGRLVGRGTADDVARAAAEIGEVERTARTALAEVREAIGGYRAKGLRAEVDSARMTLAAAGVTLVCEGMPETLRAREETALSLSVREAVTNIVRHARATACAMRFATGADGATTLEVEDNGQAAGLREGNGLRGMRARVEELGGTMRIEGAPARGTRVVIELPGGAVVEAKA